ncbi:hypothetical protein ACOME3_007108 [Neoechinorhynchus agilis]
MICFILFAAASLFIATTKKITVIQKSIHFQEYIPFNSSISRVYKISELFTQNQRLSAGFKAVVDNKINLHPCLVIYDKTTNTLLVKTGRLSNDRNCQVNLVMGYVKTIIAFVRIRIDLTIMPECGRNEFYVGKQYSGKVGSVQLVHLSRIPSLNVSLNNSLFSIRLPEMDVMLFKPHKELNISEDTLYLECTIDFGENQSKSCHMTISFINEPKMHLMPNEKVILKNDSIFIPEDYDFVENPILSVSTENSSLYKISCSSQCNMNEVRLFTNSSFQYQLSLRLTHIDFPLVFTYRNYQVFLLPLSKYSTSRDSVFLTLNNRRPVFTQLQFAETSTENDFSENVSWSMDNRDGVDAKCSPKGHLMINYINKSGTVRLNAHLVGEMSGYVYLSVKIFVNVDEEDYKQVYERMAREMSPMELKRFPKFLMVSIGFFVLVLVVRKLIQRFGSKYTYWRFDEEMAINEKRAQLLSAKYMQKSSC